MGIFLPELFYKRRKDKRSEKIRAPKGQMACPKFLEIADMISKFILQIQYLLRSPYIFFPALRQLDRADAPVEQRGAYFFLYLLDRCAERRLRDI